jgi:hypothetical protein
MHSIAQSSTEYLCCRYGVVSNEIRKAKILSGENPLYFVDRCNPGHGLCGNTEKEL